MLGTHLTQSATGPRKCVRQMASKSVSLSKLHERNRRRTDYATNSV